MISSHVAFLFLEPLNTVSSLPPTKVDCPPGPAGSGATAKFFAAFLSSMPPFAFGVAKFLASHGPEIITADLPSPKSLSICDEFFSSEDLSTRPSCASPV
ncbi:hypothetical protein D3C87_1765910 [compost metagenome]